MLCIGYLSAQEIDIKNDLLKEDIIYVISIDGKQIEISKIDDVLNDLDPEDIESINVLKDEASLIKYKAEDKDGVIEIRLKANQRTEKLLKKLEKEQKKKKSKTARG